MLLWHVVQNLVLGCEKMLPFLTPTRPVAVATVASSTLAVASSTLAVPVAANSPAFVLLSRGPTV